jgi:uncharacterized membrane protein
LKNRSWLFIVSLCLNVILLLALAAGYEYVRFERISWQMEGPHWATYAGTMQCIADHDSGTTRFYRMVTVPATDGKAERKFTGERQDGAEVWSWPWYSNLGEPSRASSQAFVDAYNRRMKSFLAEAATRPAD